MKKHRLEIFQIGSKRFCSCLAVEAIDTKDLTSYLVLAKFINDLNMPAGYSRALHVTKTSPFGSTFVCLNSHI